MSAILITLLAGILLGVGFHIIKAFKHLFTVNKAVFIFMLIFITGTLVVPIDLSIKLLVISIPCFLITASHKKYLQNKEDK